VAAISNTTTNRWKSTHFNKNFKSTLHFVSSAIIVICNSFHLLSIFKNGIIQLINIIEIIYYPVLLVLVASKCQLISFLLKPLTVESHPLYFV